MYTYIYIERESTDLRRTRTILVTQASIYDLQPKPKDPSEGFTGLRFAHLVPRHPESKPAKLIATRGQVPKDLGIPSFRSCHNWVLAKELNLSYHDKDTI